MPRKYTKKTGPTYGSYEKDSMARAINVRNNKMSISKAASMYGINRTTLMNHLKGHHAGKVGKPTILTHEEEQLIVHAIQKLADWGFGIDRQAVRCIVFDYLNSVGRSNVFGDKKPGQDWMYGFEARWRDQLTRRVGQPLPASRAYACNEQVVNDFFEKLSATLHRLGIAEKPQNIFNVDETGFSTDIGNQKILCRRGIKNPHKTVATSTKTMYTVQVCCSAIGTFLSPYVVYKGLHLYNTWCQSGPENVKYNCSPSGWMEGPQFVEWFQKVFIKETENIDGPELLVFDGHNSHISKTVNIRSKLNKEQTYTFYHSIITREQQYSVQQDTLDLLIICKLYFRFIENLSKLPRVTLSLIKSIISLTLVFLNNSFNVLPK